MRKRAILEHLAVLLSIPAAMFLLVASVVGIFPGVIAAVVGVLLVEAK